MSSTNDYNWTLEDASLEGRVNSLKKADETDNAFARRCGLDAGNITKFRQHKISLGTTYLRRIATACQVSYKWLKEGEGNRDDKEGMVSEPLPDRNRFYTNNKKEAEKENCTDDLTIELLKAENNALYAVLQNVTNSLELLQKSLEQNNKILLQNAEALSQNRALMQYLTEHVKG